MNIKISWYREVLELEPDSRLFLPLARLLADEGELDEACTVLREGIKRHPSFLEARLTYVDVLRRAGKDTNRDHESSEQLESLLQTLAAHDGFWQAWAAGTAGKGEKDTSLAIRLLALAMQGVKLDISDILRRGIESLEAEYRGFDLTAKMGNQMSAAEPAPVTSPVTSSVPADAAMPGSSHSSVHDTLHEIPHDMPHDIPHGTPLLKAAPLTATAAAAASYADTAAVRAETQPAEAPAAADASDVSHLPESRLPESHLSGISDIPIELSAPLDPGLPPAGEDADEGDEAGSFYEAGEVAGGPWPPRTVTMAEVLAEQGDIDGACDIYAELVARAASAEDAQRYAARREDLLARSRAEEAEGLRDADAAEDAEDAEDAAAHAVQAAPDAAGEASRLGPESLGMLNALVNSLQSRVQ